ncbi:hypothetical protein FB567DRAFT_39657 [Paraphoma chrysanthemicola]|uniref:DUF6604 domain-containing protein n=1 Tax=Paraphoma chrysanthemicola TaxID=798071 RepID=A0A8K0RL35_9PLEO|nr:hypothetical protein FB567DRAFT_39657 [Paraphoma chrysanthemicola]
MSGILGDVYRQYKEDTEFIAGWLAKESLKCGYELSTMGDQPQKAPRRLKGKARKQARDSSAGEPARGGNYLIKRTDFIPMAQKIAEQLPKVHVPALVEHTFNRVISERRRVSDWFRSSHGKTNTGDERHFHFIGVLKGAFATLCPFKESKVNPRATRTFGPPQVGSLPVHNAFAGLQVDVSPDELHEPQAAPAVDGKGCSAPRLLFEAPSLTLWYAQIRCLHAVARDRNGG